MNVYEKCPILENDNFTIRLIEEKDASDLLRVYSDKHALPYFNSDNCHGSNFYITNMEDMLNAIKYWLVEYHELHGFVRFSIFDKKKDQVIGTIEMFNRKSEDYYNGYGVLRLDLRSDYEDTKVISDILSLITTPFYEWFECTYIMTKAAIYAVDRIEALKEMKYVKFTEPLIGQNKIAYYDYWVCQQQ